MTAQLSSGRGKAAHVTVLVACAAALAALLLLLPVGPARAADTAPDAVSWGLAPAPKAPAVDASGGDRANYAYTADPGSTVRDAVVVTNHSAEALDLKVYAADAFTTTSGQLDLLPAGATSTDLGAWTTPAARSVHVPAHGSRTVAFTVHVPADASPGDHSAGIVTSLAQQPAGSTVRVDRRLALRMHLRVTGALAPAIRADGVRASAEPSVNPVGPVPLTVRYRVTNTGNARVVPAAVVEVAGPWGVGSVTVRDEAPEVLPGSTVERTVTVPGFHAWGRADVSVHVTAVAVGIGGGATASDDAHAATWAVPWAALLVVLLVVAGAVLLPRVVDRRRGAAGPADEPVTEPAAESADEPAAESPGRIEAPEGVS
jgi:hypothetical protein